MIPLTCSPRHASSGPPRKAADGRERADRREKADAAMLAVRLAIIVGELVKVAIDHASGGGLGRIL